MTYYTDLTPYLHSTYLQRERTINVGWLDASQPYAKGRVPAQFTERIWQFCRWPAVQTRGYHACNLCDLNRFLPVTFRGETLKLGTAEIRVFGSDGAIYAAPDLIFHYVVDHRYRPPSEFISAVNECPHPESDEYQRFLIKQKLDETCLRRNLDGPRNEYKILRRVPYKSPYNAENKLWLKAQCHGTPPPDKERIVRYLRRGLPVLLLCSTARDILGDNHVIGPVKALTDGEWGWQSVVAYWVDNYNFALPDEFVEHMRKVNWRIPRKSIDPNALVQAWCNGRE